MIHYRAIWGKKFCVHPIPDGTTGGKLNGLGEEFPLVVSHDANGDCLMLAHWSGEPPTYDFDAILRFVPSRMLAVVHVMRPADAR